MLRRFSYTKTWQLCHLATWLGVTSEKVSQRDCLQCLPVCRCIKLRSSGLMHRLVMDNNEKLSSRAKPQTTEVRILQHDPVASRSGGKFCKAQMESPHAIHNKSQAPIGNGNTKHQKTSFFSITQFLEPIKLGCVILLSHTNGLSEHICERHNIGSQQIPQPCHKRWCLNCSWSRPPNAVVRIPLGC